MRLINHCLEVTQCLNLYQAEKLRRGESFSLAIVCVTREEKDHFI